MKDMQKKLKEIEKSLTEILDSMAGDKSPAIQNALSKLADVDIEIRKALDEIEPIKQEDFEAHNKLANEANKLIEEVAAENVKGDEECEEELLVLDGSEDDVGADAERYEEEHRNDGKVSCSNDCADIVCDPGLNDGF